jgi:hypothetical protein
MTTAGQAFLFAAELFCLPFAAIALVYYAEKLRSDFLRKHQRHVARDGRVRPVTLFKTEALKKHNST